MHRVAQETRRLGCRGMGIPAGTGRRSFAVPHRKGDDLGTRTCEGLEVPFIDSFNPDLAKRLANAIRETATGIHSGKIRSGIVDKAGFTANDVAECRDSMRELVAVVTDDM
jgi:hypothetical protein